MAGIVLVGFPLIAGQGVGVCVDLALDLTSIRHLIVPIHATCGILAVIIGACWTTSKPGRQGAPTADDYTKIMLVSFLLSLALSIVPYHFMRFVWDNCIYGPTLPEFETKRQRNL